MNAKFDKQEILLLLLEKNTDLLNKAKSVLQYSMKTCLLSREKLNSLTATELESCEALTARFARAADILTQKVLKNIFLLLRENPLTFMDKCNLAEKFGIIKSADNLINIRDLRNKIAHEYFLEDVSTLFSDAAQFSAILCEEIDAVNNYAIELKKKFNKK
jgi:hypothetical protein